MKKATRKELGVWVNSTTQTLRNWQKTTEKKNLYKSLEAGYYLFNPPCIGKSEEHSNQSNLSILQSNTTHLKSLIGEGLVCREDEYLKKAKKCIEKINEIVQKINNYQENSERQ